MDSKKKSIRNNSERKAFEMYRRKICSYDHDQNFNDVGAGALIPYKRGIDDVGWFICYRHS